MKHFLLTLVTLAFASFASAQDLHEKHVALRQRLGEVVDVFLPGAAQHRYFIPGTQFKADNEKQQAIADAYAARLIKLAKQAAENEPAWAYQLLHEAAYFGSGNLADTVVASKVVEPKARLATSNHPRLKWKRKQYYRVASAHYQVVTRDKEAGIEIAKRLENLHAVWRQIFFDCWSDSKKLRSAIEVEKKLAPARSRLHRVVLFESQQAYTAYLQKEQPRIGITRGFYDMVARTSYFFPSDDTTATQFHEAAHQLFQEVQRASERLKMVQNFWAIEGIAMYMESVQRHGDVVLVGGPGSRRLQFARYRRLQEENYVPLGELVGYGREKLQSDPAIGQIYSQSAGLAHFLMDGENRKHRDGLIRYLRAIYDGKDRVDSLPAALGEDLSTIDARYAEYLQVTDGELLAAKIPANSLRSLCLGTAPITSRSLSKLAAQAKLEWLDLAGLDIDVDSLGFLRDTKTLTQVSFDRCQKIDDRVLPILAQNRQLDELDLSGTAISDQALKHLRQLPSLTTLWVSNTSVTDACLPIVAGLPSLKSFACGGTQISAKGLQALKAQRPDLEIVE